MRGVGLSQPRGLSEFFFSKFISKPNKKRQTFSNGCSASEKRKWKMENKNIKKSLNILLSLSHARATDCRCFFIFYWSLALKCRRVYQLACQCVCLCGCWLIIVMAYAGRTGILERNLRVKASGRRRGK